jgi:hypothetical protein
MRSNPSKRQRVELARVTHTRAPKREPFTHSLVPQGKGAVSRHALPERHHA